MKTIAVKKKTLLAAAAAAVALASPMSADAKPRGLFAKLLAPVIGQTNASKLDDYHRDAGKPLDQAGNAAKAALGSIIFNRIAN